MNENLEMLYFLKTFPGLNFYDLQKQNKLIATNDGCNHYKHCITGKFYSFDYTENEWFLNTSDNLWYLFK
jgi:hypothetical protein